MCLPLVAYLCCMHEIVTDTVKTHCQRNAFSFNEFGPPKLFQPETENGCFCQKKFGCRNVSAWL